MAQSTTLYAKWTPNPCTVTLDNQSAMSSGTAAVVAIYGNAMPAIIVPTRTDYIFDGYYTATSGGGIVIIRGAR